MTTFNPLDFRLTGEDQEAREAAEDEQLALGTHYLDADGNVQAKAPVCKSVTPVSGKVRETDVKLSYEIGDDCWIYLGSKYPDGRYKKTYGKVVFWFDLPDLVQRLYVIRIPATTCISLCVTLPL